MKNKKPQVLTLKKFRELTKHLPEDTCLAHHSYYKGCSLTPYLLEEFWIFPKDPKFSNHKAVVINPGEEYDYRGTAWQVRKLQAEQKKVREKGY